MAKSLYQGLFDWMISKQSDISKVDSSSRKETLQLFDCPGFEIFDQNSLGQFLINYSNEKMQHLFNEYYFKEEKTLFEREGLSSYFKNFQNPANDDILILIDCNHPQGIIQHLTKKTDTTRVTKNQLKLLPGQFLMDVSRNLKTSPFFERVKGREKKFYIKHGYESVLYTVDEFIIKNIDEIHRGLYNFLEPASGPLKDMIFPTLEKQDKNQSWTISQKFKNDISRMTKEFQRSKCKFIRCITPNAERKFECWDQVLVLKQLKFLGIQQFLSNKKDIFPIRMEYDDFCSKFIELNPKINEFYNDLNTPGRDWRSLAQDTIEHVCGAPDNDEILFGKKKVFMCSSLFLKIELKMEDYVS